MNQHMCKGEEEPLINRQGLTDDNLRGGNSFCDLRSAVQDLMAALLLAEEFFSVEQLKPWWRLWALPTPMFTLEGGPPSCLPILPAPNLSTSLLLIAPWSS